MNMQQQSVWKSLRNCEPGLKLSFLHLLINKLNINETNSKYKFIGNNYLYQKFTSLNLYIKINDQSIVIIYW